MAVTVTLWVVRGKSAISWQDGSVIMLKEMGGKEGGSNETFPNGRFWGGSCRDQTGGPDIATALCVEGRDEG